MTDIVCPNCRRHTTIVHTWRVDMTKLQTIDSFKCLGCGERWEERVRMKTG